MIGLMIPSVSGQVQVTVTPLVDSWKIGEINHLDITVDRIVPNTNFCFEYIFDDGEVKTFEITPRFSENIHRHLLNDLFVVIWNGPSDEHVQKFGEIDITVLYGTCTDENFGTATTSVNRVNELESTTEFMMKNYSLESIDVGTLWSINEPSGEGWSHHSVSPDATFYQSFGAIRGQYSEITVLYSNDGFSSDQISKVSEILEQEPEHSPLD